MNERVVAAWHVLTGMAANASGRVPYPRIAHFCPTWQCNQQCNGCTVWSRSPEAELSGDEVVRMFSTLPFLDVVKLVGGEPFARDDLTEICEGIFRWVRPYILQIVTNGSQTGAIIDLVKRVGSPRLHLRISLSGIGETHERLSNGSSYPVVHQTLTALTELRPRFGFSLGINYRVSDETVDDLAEAMRIYRPLGIDVVPGVHYWPFLQDVDVANTDFHADIKNPQRILEALARIPTERANMSWVERFLLGRFSNRTAQRGLADDPKKKRFGCRELRNLLYILPTGDLVLCGLRQAPVANLAREDFKSIWFSRRMDEHRRAVDDCAGCPQASIEIFSRLYLGPFQKWVISRQRR